MKIRSLFLILLLAAFAPWTTSFAQQTMTIGTGTNYALSGSSQGNSFGSPFGNCYYYNSTAQFIYTAEELNGAKTITSVAFNHNGNSFNANVNIYLFHTTASTVAINAPVTAGTPVYTGSGIAVGGSSAGWQTFQLTTPFEYNGNDNLLVVVCRTNSGNGWSGNIGWQYTVTTDNKYMVRSSDTDNYGYITNPNNYTASTNRPNIQIGYQTTDPYISLAPASETVFTGFTKTLTATYGNVTGTPTITYTSSNEGVATVSGSGTTATVTGEAPGTATITATMNYQGTDYTATAAITVEDPSYCEPVFGGGYSIYITNFTTEAGINNSTGFSTGGYGDYYDSHSAEIEPGETLDFTVSQGSQWGCGFAIWVDWNQDYEFSADERVAATSATQTTSWSGSFSVPSATAVGDYRMRVLMQYNTSSPSNPCVSTDYGEGEDYKLTVIAPGNCPKPRTLAASNVAVRTATLTWTMDSPLDATADGFNVEYKKAADPDEPLNWTRVGTAYDLLTTTISGLTPETEYTARVQAACGNNEYSDWRNIAENFTTGIACPAPTALAVTEGSVTASGATVTWEGTSSDGYVVMIGEENLFAKADFETGDLSQADFTTTSSYPWTVVANNHSGTYCAKSGNGRVNNSTSDMVLEVTLANDATLTFSAKVSSEATYDKAYFSIDGTPQSNLNGISGNGNWIDYTYSLTAGTHTLRWYYTKDDSDYYYDDCFYVDDIVVSAGVSSWTEYTTANLTYTFENLAANTGYQVRVKGNCGTEDGYSAETAPVSFTTPDDCPNPGKPTESEVTAHTAVISWEGNGLTEFNLEYIYAGYNEWFSRPGVTSPCTIEGLPASTEIQVRVQGTCDAANNEWSETLFFMTDVSCPVPTNVRITEGPTAHGVTIEWDAEEGEMFQYVMLHGTVTDFTNVNWGTPEETNTASWNTLYADYDWTFAIRKYCGESDQSEVVSLTFTTLVACPAPTTPVVTDITGHTATLNWTGTSESYNVYYNTPASVNGSTEEFSSSLPSGWTLYSGALNDDGTGPDPSATTTSGWGIGSQAGVFEGSSHIRYNMYSNWKYWLVTPSFAVENGCALSFDLAYTAYNSANPPGQDGYDDRFVILISTDEKQHWTILREWNNAGTGNAVLNNVSTSGETVPAIDLSAYAGETAYIAFYGGSTEDNTDNHLRIDNVSIGDIVPAGPMMTATTTANTIEITGLDPETTYEAYVVGDCGTEGLSAPSNTVTFTTVVACLPVGTLAAATEVKSTSAKLSWALTDDTQNHWEVAYSPSPLGAGYTYVDATTNNGFLLEGLNPETLYYVKVRANCGSEDGYGEWSNEISFTTLGDCFTPYNIVADNITAVSANITWTGEGDSYNVMYREVITAPVNVNNTYDFETGNLQGWTTIDADGHGNAWSVFNSTTSAYNSTYSMRATYNSNYDHEDYLVSPQIPLGGTFSFYAKKGGSWNDTFRVYLSTTGNTSASDFSIELTDGNVLPETSYNQYTYDLSSYSGNGYVAIVYTAPADQYYLYVDDINYVCTIEGEYGPWQDATSYTESVTLNGLEANKTYEVKVQGVCSGGPTDWSDIFEFTTPVPFFTKEILAHSAEGEEMSGWYLIASPLYNSVYVNEVSHITDNEFDLYRFNQAPTMNNEGEYLEWENYKKHTADFLIESGIGYLYANSGNVTLTFTGYAYEDISNEYDKAIQLKKTDDNPDANMHGWNLVGNPYGRINAYIDREFYVMNPEGNDIVPSGERNYIEPMEGAFVYAEEDGELFTFYKRPENSNDNKGALSINVMEAANHRGSRLVDRTVVRFGEGDALPKFQLNPNHTKVYIPQGNKDCAVVYSEGQGEMPLSFRANENGTYTLSFNAEEVTFNYLHLIDNMTGADVDLLAATSTGSVATYTFEARTTDYSSRFKLVFATGSNNDSDNFAFYSNGTWVISNDGEATLQVVDVMGRIVKSESINGSASINVNAAPGVYTLRLVNGNDVKVQKVVVE